MVLSQSGACDLIDEGVLGVINKSLSLSDEMCPCHGIYSRKAAVL